MDAGAERAVTFSDGARTTVRVWGNAGPLLVAIHGLGSSRMAWSRIAEHVGGRFRVAAYDQRGHGDSAAVSDMRFARSVDDCLEVVGALGEPVHAVLGHSWGGAVAIGAGRRAPVERVVAIDPMVRVERNVWRDSVVPEYRAMVAQTPEQREESVRATLAHLPAVETASKLHATRALTLAPIEALGRENAIDDGAWNFMALLDAYPRPLLLALSDVKRSVFGAADRAAARECGGPNVRLDEYPGAGHSLHRDAFDRFIPDLERFLG